MDRNDDLLTEHVSSKAHHLWPQISDVTVPVPSVYVTSQHYPAFGSTVVNEQHQLAFGLT
jgi:hypothetical protein